jgi:CHAT domain-containing protein
MDLIDNYSITYLPSVSAWPYIKQNVGKANANPLIIGNPVTNNADLEPLPFAESEAQAIAGLYRTTPLIGKNATESAVQSQVGRAGVLHLAAHGSYNTIDPMYSAIYLAPDEQNDGLLETHEIYGLDLKHTDLVVLSACDTQLGELSTGDELVGLTRAFLFAGTPSVISSLWSVDDKATQLLMEKFYTYWRSGKGKAEALRQAQMDVRAEYPNPYYWAGFVLNGDGGKPMEAQPTESVPVSRPFPICVSGFSPIALIMVGVLVIKKRKNIHFA